jgi:endonuclease-3
MKRAMGKRKTLLVETDRRLLRYFGPRKFTLREKPLDNLVWTVLSQNTTDLTADRAYRQLRRRFPTWTAVLRAPRRAVEETLRLCGLQKQKTATIQGLLRRLQAERGRLSLSFLRRLPPEEATAWLTASPGIGTKTAAVALLFSFAMPLFPVDTHIRRVSGRLGLVPEGAPAHRVQELLAAVAPKAAEVCARLHLSLIQLGREICHPRAPECRVCPLRAICRHARKGDRAC